MHFFIIIYSFSAGICCLRFKWACRQKTCTYIEKYELYSHLLNLLELFVHKRSENPNKSLEIQ